MPTSSTDQVRKEITLSASQSRVWRAISDSTEFGEWFKVRLDGPFQQGETVRGQITHPGCEHMVFLAYVESIEPEHLFAFRWHPHADEADFDFENEATTTVEFRLAAADGGTRLTVTESGFDGLPEHLREKCFLRNEGGWVGQMENIKKHIDG